MTDQDSTLSTGNISPPRSPSPFPEDVRARFRVDLEATYLHDECPDNPTKIDKPFWKYMIGRGCDDAWHARRRLGGLSPGEVRPVFCFNRFGRTETLLPDGRVVFIGGEHEDFYDPDFFIYNDVVVVRGHGDGRAKAEVKVDAHLAFYDDDYYSVAELQKLRESEIRRVLGNAESVKGASPDEIDIYGYPVDVFLPTDFHTATYHKDEVSGKEYVYIIGGLGYVGSPHRSTTLTHRLDLQDFSIQRLETEGQAPPGAKEGKAEKDGNVIRYTTKGHQCVLSLTDLRWSKAPSSGSHHPPPT